MAYSPCSSLSSWLTVEALLFVGVPPLEEFHECTGFHRKPRHQVRQTLVASPAPVDAAHSGSTSRLSRKSHQAGPLRFHLHLCAQGLCCVLRVTPGQRLCGRQRPKAATIERMINAIPQSPRIRESPTSVCRQQSQCRFIPGHSLRASLDAQASPKIPASRTLKCKTPHLSESTLCLHHHQKN